MFVGFLIADTRMSSIQRGDKIQDNNKIQACDQSFGNSYATRVKPVLIVTRFFFWQVYCYNFALFILLQGE